MSRLVALVSVLILSIGTLTALAAHSVVAQGDAPPFLIEHPLVGAWMLDPDRRDLGNLSQLVVVSADGTYHSTDAAGRDMVGTWQATGPRTATNTLVAFAPGEGGTFGDTVKVRGAVEVAADGQSFTATYTVESVGADGVGTGQFGPISASGKRIVVEPMGTPVSGPAA
jgi:hypothetical protein